MQKLYFFILLFFLFLTGNKTSAQTFQYDWTDAHGGGTTIAYTASCWGSSYSYPCTQYDTPQYSLAKLASDQSGNIFHAGRTNRPFDINSGAGTNMITPATYLYNSGYGVSTLYNYANFIAKHDNNGVLQWAGNIKALTGNDNAAIVSITPVAGNYLLVAGTFYGTVNFDINGTNSQSRTTIGNNDIFFAKYNSLNGDLIWVKTIGGISTDYLSDLKTDNFGNIILAGYTYSANLDVNPEAGVSLVNTTGSQASFIVKYDSDGNLVSSLERVLTNSSTKISVDSGNNIYELSSYSGTRDLNGTTGTTNFTANGTHSFVSKYSSSGNYLWTKEIKRDNNTNISSTPIDFVVKNDHLYFVLRLSNDIDVNPSPSVETLLSPNGYSKFCIVEWDSDGNYLWNLFHSGNFPYYIDQIDVNNQGEISYTERDYTGYDVDPTSGVMNLASGNAYWTKLNADHSINYVASLNFPSSRQFSDIIYDNQGSVIFGGFSNATTANLNSADLAEDSFSGQNVGAQNYFITKYLLDCPTPTPTADAAQIFCNSATVANLSATGTAIKWYAASTLGSELPTTTALVSGTTYYASQTLNSCESTNRTAVAVTINTTAAPTALATQPFCNAATIANLSATGTAIKWYDAAASGAQLLPTAALVNGTKYYASQTLNGCESILRTEVTAVINTTAAPSASATQPFCNAATIANLSATGTAIKWYDAASSGTQLLATASLVNGTKYYASQTLNGCESILRTEVTAVINTTAAPTASATQPFCNAATVANLSATGTAIKWYDAASSGTQLLATAALVNGTKYYASQTLNGCESILRAEVTAVINTTAAPSAAATQPFCNAATVANLSATGTAIKWYDAASSGTQLLATAALVNGTKYYASQTLNGCESILRTEVTAVINTTAAPTASATQPFCNAATIANLSTTGTAIKWYDAASSGTQLLATAALVNGTKYYASQTLNGCESILRTEVTAVINTTAAPTASATQPFCNAATVANLSATGTAIKWYDAASSGTQLLATAALVNGTKYYASQTLNGCESILRTEVTAVINTTVAPSAASTQSFCNAATIANLSATGTAIKWYDAATSGAQLLPTAALVNGTKYYASQTLNGCESILRTEVTAVINTTAAPTASATQPFCNATTVASLSATGTAIKWYDAASSGTQLLATATLVNGTKYYASQTLNGCESILRTEVTAVINTTAAPSATATQPFCNAATVASLSATGTAIKWYDAAASGAQLLPTAALVNGTKYYASQTLNGCESILRTEVTAVINTTAAPTASATQPFCNAATVASLSATGTAIKWYDAAASGAQLLPTAALVNGTKYYASQTLNGCESILRTEVTAVINTTAAPSAAATQSFCNAATIANLSATGTAIKWYDAASSGTQLLATAALVNGTKYYASQTLNGCESILRTEVTAVINTTAAPSAAATQSFCNAATIANLLATGTAIKWYDAASSGTQLLPTAALVNGTKYYASQTLNGCESILRTGVTAVINTTAAPSATATQPFCNATTVASLSATGTAIKWYDAASSGTQLLATAALVNGTKYYASQTLNGCESILRTEVTAVINTTAAPTASATQPFCNAATVANLSATGTSIKWYDVATSGAQLLPTATLVNGTKYYASQTLNGCESTLRTQVTVIINVVAAPTGNTNQEFCNSAKIEDLAAVGSNIQWFAGATGGIALSSNIILVNGVKYYASQTINGCQSASRLAVTAVIKTVPNPTGPGIQQFCSESNPTLSDVYVNSDQVIWYDSFVNGNILSLDYRLTDGETVYAGNYDSNTKCESASRLAVTVKIIDSKLEYYNLITVNGNNLNNKLTIKGIDKFPVNNIEIFNRYGNLVWKADNYNNENNFFEGKSNSRDVFMKNNFLPTGTYYFVLKYRTNCKSNQLKGFLQIDNNQ